VVVREGDRAGVGRLPRELVPVATPVAALEQVADAVRGVTRFANEREHAAADGGEVGVAGL
jgi:hypothetical protein